jgi:Zn-dependent M28 family amino/carboxypeptidase
MISGCRLSGILLLFQVTFSMGQVVGISFSDSAVVARLRQDVFTLASDSFAGRESGTEGELMACRYISAKFAEAGLDPKGTDSGSFLQPFPNTWVKFADSNRLTVAGITFWPYDDFGLTGYSASGSATGKISDVGDLSRISTDSAGTSVYASLAGTITLIDCSSVSPSGKMAGTMVTDIIADRIRDAQENGAEAVILWNVDLRKGIYPEIFHDKGADTAGIPVIYASRHVVKILQKNPDSIVTLTAALKRTHKTFYNLIGYIDNGAASDIILGAHFDHLGKHNGRIYNGADDNASGAAMVMELARYFAGKRDTSHNYIFICFGGEEKGLLGSEHYATHPVLPLSRVKFMANFDMVGRMGCEGQVIFIEATGSSPVWGKLIRQMKDDAPFGINKVIASLPFSDQYPFYKKGVPVTYFTTGMHRQYHKPEDDPELINYTGMKEIAGYSVRYLNAAAGSDDMRFRKVSWISTAGAYIKVFFELIL